MGKKMDRKDTENEENRDQSCVPMSPSISPAIPLDLSYRSNPFLQTQTSPLDLSKKTTPFYTRQMSVDDKYEAPVIVIQPKTEWHYRSVKDLANKHLPCLAGNGPQRTPIRVTVPSRSDKPLYLATAIVTVKYESHPSKVIVPAKTKVNSERFSHNNQLDYLQFDECNPLDDTDVENRCIYSEINPAEYRAGYKDVRIYMFNLYQSPLITKEMIMDKQLNRCVLRFCLCIRQNNEYKPISAFSYSSIIEEKKMTTKPRSTHQINKPTALSIPYPVSSPNDDDMDEDSSNDDMMTCSFSIYRTS